MYKATLEDDNLVTVKRRREKITKAHEEFEAEAAVLGKIRHLNLLTLRAYYLGPKGEKLLVFDYVPKGSLSAFLHGQSLCFTILIITSFVACVGFSEKKLTTCSNWPN
jgi:serine/threonine protein kinase